MDKPKHTPGPWKVLVLDGETYINPRRDDGEYALICKLTPASGPRADANARLISAAPEMLDALLGLLSDPYLADPINNDRMFASRLAIRKATGEK